MQIKKLVPLALAVVMMVPAGAGAAHMSWGRTATGTCVASPVCAGRGNGWCSRLTRPLYGGRLDRWTVEMGQQAVVPQPETTPAPDTTPTPDVTPSPYTPPAPDVTPAPDPAVRPSQPDLAAQVVALVNGERAKQGLPALTVDAQVQQAAQVRAGELVRSFAHTRPNGASFSTALTAAGVVYRTAGENIAYGQSSPQQVMQAWMGSSGHRANILNARYTTIGVGYIVVDGTAYWAQLFTA
ncbi:MAG: CAP domain-containing protein [Eubacteriales bacterium]|nr:CAP domain-containing protein [Eubacteriales bacterium]